MLQFSDANNKLKALYDVPELQVWLDGRQVYSLDLLSGWSCPFAKECLSKVYETGNLTKSGNPQVKLRDGKDTCFVVSPLVKRLSCLMYIGDGNTIMIRCVVYT